MPDVLGQIVGQHMQNNPPKLSPYAKPWVGQYRTTLTPAEEQEFQQWARQNPQFMRGETGPYADYDVRGFWKAMKTGDPRAAQSINPEDHQLHAPDIWKTPYHRSFSNESIYAKPNAPRWNGNQLIDEHGNVVFDEGKK